MKLYIMEEILNDIDNPNYKVVISKSKSYLNKIFDKYDRDCRFGKKQYNQDVIDWYYDLQDVKPDAFINIPQEILEYD